MRVHGYRVMLLWMLCAVGASRGSAEEFAVRNWYLLGPFELNAQTGPDALDPTEVAAIVGNIQDGTNWQEHRSLSDWIDLSSGTAFGEKERVSGYAAVIIETTGETPLEWTVSADDFMAAWWNGVPVLEKESRDLWPPLPDTIHVWTQPGRNLLLLSVLNRYGAWGFRGSVRHAGDADLVFRPGRDYLTALPVGEARASSTEGGQEKAYGAALAFDGDRQTRWSSAHGDGQWIEWGFSDLMIVNRVRILWEAAHAREYEIQASQEGDTWYRIQYGEGHGGEAWIEIPHPAPVRFLRILCHQRATQWGFSIWEIECFGYPESREGG